MKVYQQGDYVSCRFRFTWGLSPADASVVLAGAPVLPALKEAVKLVVDGAEWWGTLAAEPQQTTFPGGVQTTLSLLDYRSRLMDDVVFCVFNRAVVMEYDPLTPGVDRRRKWEHITPDEWDAQNKVRTDAPKTAKEIIESVLANSPSFKVDWKMEYHASMSAQGRPLEIECNGKKLGSLLSEIANELGLQFRIKSLGEDDHTIVWGRRGEGLMPDTFSAARPQWTDGEARTWADTQVIISGDRKLHQIMVTLEPDWATAWEAYWLETEWLKRVDTVFGPYASDSAGRAQLAAKAREVTLQEYVNLCGDYGEDSHTFEDFRTWQDIGRMDMPAYIYLRDVVYKAYRIPRDVTVAGTNLDSLEIHEGGLIADVEHDAGTGVISYMEPRQYYPPTKAYCIVKGAEVERLFDPRLNKALTDEQLANARNTWVPNGRFQIDRKAKTFVFDGAQILFGEGASALFLFPNRGTVASGHPLYNVAVPNAAATITPAEVKVCMVVEAGRYSKIFGSGDRTGAQYVSGLTDHILRRDTGELLETVPFFQIESEPKTADDIAQIIGDNMLSLPESMRTGTQERKGNAGGVLTGVIESIGVEVDFAGGITEQYQFSTERSAAGWMPRHMLERTVRSADLFPGQTELRNEARTLRAIGDAMARTRRAQMEGAPANAQEALQRPVGETAPGTRVVNVASSTDAGVPLFQKAHDESVSTSGEVFAGVATMNGGDGMVPVATRGTAAVKVQGPFTRGTPVGVRDTEQFARVMPEGHKVIGRVMADYEGTSTILAPVELGAAHSALKPAELKPWQVYVTGITQTDGVATAVKVKLNPDSTLLLSSDLTDAYDASEDLATEYSLQFGHCLWMEFNFGSDGAFSTMVIKSGVPASNGWTDFGTAHGMYKFAGAYPDDLTQTAWVMLARIDAAGDLPVVATFGSGAAALFNHWHEGHMMLTQFCVLPADGGERIGYVTGGPRAYTGGTY